MNYTGTWPATSQARLLVRGLYASSSATGLLVPHFVLLAIIATPITLVFHPDSFIRKVLCQAQLYLIACAFVAPLPQHGSQADLYNLGLLVGGQAAKILDRVHMHVPEKTFLRKGIDDKAGSGPETYGPARKFRWATEMIISQRGIGWNWQVGGVPKPDFHKRWAFVGNRLYKISLTFFLIHLVSVLATMILSDEAGAQSSFAGLARHPLVLRLFITVGWLTVVYGHVALPENISAVVMVGSGVWGRWSDPEQWPPMFGDASEAYTLRRCWGKFWHALLRRTTNAPGDWVVQRLTFLRQPKNRALRLTRRYFMLFTAFLVSGLIHTSGSYMVTRDSVQGVSDGGALVYFLAQPAAICVEDAVLSLMGVGDDGNPSTFRRCLGYVCVACFWLWCFPSLKVMPLADAHGLNDPRGEMLGAVRACRELAEAFPVNPAKSLWNYMLK